MITPGVPQIRSVLIKPRLLLRGTERRTRKGCPASWFIVAGDCGSIPQPFESEGVWPSAVHAARRSIALGKDRESFVSLWNRSASGRPMADSYRRSLPHRYSWSSQRPPAAGPWHLSRNPWRPPCVTFAADEDVRRPHIVEYASVDSPLGLDLGIYSTGPIPPHGLRCPPSNHLLALFKKHSSRYENGIYFTDSYVHTVVSPEILIPYCSQVELMVPSRHLEQSLNCNGVLASHVHGIGITGYS